MDWTQLISSVGFPIACVMGLAYFVWCFSNKVMTDNKEREEKYIVMLTQSNKMLEECQKTNALFIERLENIEAAIGDIKDELKNSQ